MNDHVTVALVFALLIGIALGVLGAEIWRKLKSIIKAWRFRHKVLDVYTPPVDKEKK